MRLLVLLVVMLVCALPATANASVGTTTVLSISDYPGFGPYPGEGQDWKFNVGATTQTVNRLNVYLGSGNKGKPEIGLYNNASPHAKLASCTITAPVAGAWNSCSIPTTTLNANTAVWMAVLQPGQSDVQIKRSDSGGLASNRLGTGGKSTLPATWSNGVSFGAQNVSMYADSSTTTPPPLPQCSDGVDNADPEDTLADYPNDPGCTSASDDDETDPVTPPADTTPPDTSITSQPNDPTTSTTAAFSFTGSDNVAVTGYDCQLDQGAWTPCSSPASYTVAVGTHTFSVRAKDAAGNVDPTPATDSWTVQADTGGGTGGTEPGPIAGQGYHQVWGDEFDALGSTDWSSHIWYDPGAPAGSIFVQNGILHLVSKRSDGYPNVTVTTEGDATTAHYWKYGYFEARMKWDKGNGAWPAFWLYSYQHAIDSNQCTTQAGEIDAFEGQGSQPNVFYGTVHSNTNGCSPSDTQNGNNYQDMGHDLTTDFHTVGVKWTPTMVTWYLDGVQTHSAPTYSTDNQTMFLLFQMWIGGWTTGTDATTPAALETQVDWVHVWQQ